MDEHDIHHAFTKGDMFYADAVIRLQRLGYDRNEADRIVSEWADAAEAESMSSDYQEDCR
jgi:hypothetical protein